MLGVYRILKMQFPSLRPRSFHSGWEEKTNMVEMISLYDRMVCRKSAKISSLVPEMGGMCVNAKVHYLGILTFILIQMYLCFA